MPVFEYQGIRKSDGRPVKGLKDSDAERSLRAALKRDGVLVTGIREKSAGQRRGEIDFKKFFRRVTRMDVALSTRQLATLTKSGISLVEALNAVIDQSEKPDLKTALTDVRDQVNQGTSLSEAFGRHAKYFDHLYCNMVNAGEQSGTLDQVLGRLADFIEAQNRLRSKVVSAMAYPAFMAVIGTVIIGVMMVVVVPKVTSIFENFGRELPWYTSVLIATSNFMRGYWWLLLVLIVGAIVGFRRWKRTPAGLYDWHRFVLWAPIFGSLAMMLAISRFSKTLSTLLASGVPLLTAMDITKGVLGNVVLEKVIVEASSSIREGESIADPLKASGRFPPIVTHMIAIGERSGQLEEMLENVAGAYDAQVDSKILALTSLLEPVMIVIMGAGAFGIAFSILMPLIQMNEFVQ
ncbi:MAG: type II secretion system inner membrane protein GspF [Deltaproteobacteria bacterium]|nr:type II secretion system inner membrane protein GspF [Deltaproteobacteria bacterium]